MDHKAGDQIGEYTLLKMLGQGSSGEVWSGENYSQQAVIKLTPLSGWKKLEFEREVDFLENITHANIVKMFDWKVKKKTGILIIEKMDQDLLEFLDDYNINEAEARMMFRQIIEGVGHLHKNKIAHMDIKPENILIRGSSELKLADFGSIYQWNEESPSTSGKAGTSFYCAPEVKCNKSYSAEKADIWSLGITLHVMMTGFWPYLGQTEKEVLSNAKKGKVDIAEEHLSDSLVDFLNTMLHVNPNERPCISTLLTHKWFTQESESVIAFTPRGLDSTTEIDSKDMKIDVSGLSLPEISMGGLKSPRQCQMVTSPRMNEENGYHDGFIRPSPRGNPSITKQTKLGKILNNFRKFGKKL